MKKSIHFIYFLHLTFHVITAPQTLKGRQKVQGLTLIQAVLFLFEIEFKFATQIQIARLFAIVYLMTCYK